MTFVYILISIKNKTYYIGSTSNLSERVKHHNAGYGSIYTKLNGPWQLVCFKECGSISEARQEEKLVKSTKAAMPLKK